MTFTAGCGTGGGTFSFSYPAMAGCTTAVKCFPKRRGISLALSSMALGAARLLILHIDKRSGIGVGRMVARAASGILERFDMQIMGKFNHGPSKIPEDIGVLDLIYVLLAAGDEC